MFRRLVYLWNVHWVQWKAHLFALVKNWPAGIGPIDSKLGVSCISKDGIVKFGHIFTDIWILINFNDIQFFVLNAWRLRDLGYFVHILCSVKSRLNDQIWTSFYWWLRRQRFINFNWLRLLDKGLLVVLFWYSSRLLLFWCLLLLLLTLCFLWFLGRFLFVMELLDTFEAVAIGGEFCQILSNRFIPHKNNFINSEII